MGGLLRIRRSGHVARHHRLVVDQGQADQMQVLAHERQAGAFAWVLPGAGQRAFHRRQGSLIGGDRRLFEEPPQRTNCAAGRCLQRRRQRLLREGRGAMR